MTQKTKDMLLAQLSQLSRKVERAGRAGRRHSFTALTQQLLLVQHFVDDNLPRHLRPAYDELLGGMATALSALPPQPSPEERQQTVQLLGELMGYLQKRTEELRTGKKLIVFLPYKASMWDSLESIWMAADKDKEHCDTMVVPIPYCDRNPDATVARWHYEINDFPKYVPVIDHRTVDLAKLHPDVIFIHNPYDNCNAVTSVDMQYYSRYLKNYTDNLVYVPYFVVGDTIAEHFCQAPGVVNADHVIVQDENIKEQYERYYPGGNPPAGKFLALGSPKFDKVQHTTRADYTLPTEWLRLIRGRKIVLYNTSLTTMLNYTSFFCRKLREVFEFFRQRQDVVLWWRPHPLLRATFESMRPDHYEEYCALEQQYREEGWGIFDDTVDIDRAVVCSDAYYGDFASSVVWLYRVTDKPMLFQEMSEIRFAPYFFFGLAEASDGSWLLRPFLRNGLLRVDPRTGQMHLVKDFARRGISLEAAFNNPYFASQQIGEQYYILPWASCDLCIYDMRSESYQHVDLSQQGLAKRLYIAGARAYEGYLYCWGYKYGIIEYDIQAQHVVATYQLADVQLRGHDVYGILNVAAVVGTRLYLAHNQMNGFIWFDCESKASGICKAGTADMCFASLVAVGKQLWLLGRAPYLVCYDLQAGTWEQFKLPVRRHLQMEPYFVNIFHQDNQLLLLPCCEYAGAEEIIRYDLVSGQLHIEYHVGGYSQAVQLQDGSVAAQDLQQMQIDQYTSNGAVRVISLCTDRQLEREWRRDYQHGAIQQFGERYSMSLTTFIQELSCVRIVPQSRLETAGKRIYSEVVAQ